MAKTLEYCSFCGRSKKEVNVLISGINANICDSCIEQARDIVMQNLMCPSMLCILSLQDWLSIDEKIRLADPDKERINIPANPRHYWRYRMHLNIEDLMKNKEFNEMVTTLIDQAAVS